MGQAGIAAYIPYYRVPRARQLYPLEKGADNWNVTLIKSQIQQSGQKNVYILVQIWPLNLQKYKSVVLHVFRDTEKYQISVTNISI